MRDIRSLAAVVAALALMQVASGALAVSVPLALDLRDYGAFAIGVTTAFFGVGLMVGALTAPDFIVRVGHIRAFAFFAALAAALSLTLFMRIDPFAWSLVRFGIGACSAGIYTAGESWIATAASENRRGSLLGVYHVLAKAALVAGALAVGGFAADGPAPYMIAGAVFALCLAPVAATRQAQPASPSSDPLSPRRLFKLAPAAVYAVATAGLINAAVMGLAPIYAAASAPMDDPVAAAGAAAAFYAALTLGGVVSQFPAGWLSDRVDRRLVVGALAALAAASSFALAVTPPAAPQPLQLLLAFLWGSGSLSFYGVAVAHAIDRSTREYHAQIIGGLLLVHAVGSIAGPPAAGLVMQAGLGGAGLFVYAGLGLAALVFLMTRRAAARVAVEPDEREPFATVQVSSLMAAELDPRTDSTIPAEEPSEEPAEPDVKTGPVGKDAPYTGEDPV